MYFFIFLYRLAVSTETRRIPWQSRYGSGDRVNQTGGPLSAYRITRLVKKPAREVTR